MKNTGTIIGKFFFFSLVIFAIVGIASSMFDLGDGEKTEDFKEIPYNEFLVKVEKNEVKEVLINLSSPNFTVIDNKEKKYITQNPKTENFKEFLLKEDIKVTEVEIEVGFPFKKFIITILFIWAIFHLLGRFTKNKLPSMKIDGKTKPFKNSNEKDIPKITFENIAGHESAKKDVKFIVDFLKNPKRYKEMGARLPKGIILYGEPGTGKTLLAKAIAGEAEVPFFSVSGSDFVEMFVGVGAKRVRELFSEARKQSPCIIFIDELDAVGKKRGSNMNSSESDQTINALLTELDGFSASEGIVVIGATNRLEVLDDALIRPGRFDKHIAIPLPEMKERKEILLIHSKNKKVSETVDFDTLAKVTIGFSGAGLESLMNESAILAVSREKKAIDKEDIDDAYYKVIMRGDKKDIKEVSEEQLRLVAWHEGGHALVAKLLTTKSVAKVTIVPSTNGAGGVTLIIPEKAGLHTKKDIMNDIKVLYAGRIAEYLLTNDENLITTGASQDIKQATNLLLGMIKAYGMTDEFGMLYVEGLSAITDSEVLDVAKKLSKEIYQETLGLMKENKETLEQIALRLLEKETIEEKELTEIIFPTK